MTVAAVGFDLDDTLAVPDRTRTAILRDAAGSVGGPALAERVTREAYLAAHREHGVAETREPVFDAILDARAAGSDADPSALAAAYRERTAAAIGPVAGAERLLSGLRERYRVGLLTNGPSLAQRDKLRELGWADAFDVALVTGELGYAKPDPRAFATLCRELDADPGATAYVGDDPEADVVGAAEAGLWTVHVLGDDGEPHPRADAAVRRSALADELPGVLAALDA